MEASLLSLLCILVTVSGTVDVKAKDLIRGSLKAAFTADQSVGGLVDVKKRFSEKMALRKEMSLKLGVAFCEDKPSVPASKGNLVAAFDGEKFGGWRGERMATTDGPSGIKIHKYEGIQTKFDGPHMSFFDLPKGEYKLSGWVKLESNKTASSYIHNSIRFPGETMNQAHIVATGLAKTHCWTKLQGGFSIHHRKSSLTLHVGGLTAASHVYLAGYEVTAVNATAWRNELDARINLIRKRDLVLRIRTNSGRPVPAYVYLDQIGSFFPFGAAASSVITKDAGFQDWFRKRFRWAVYENEAKWYANEHERGKKNYKAADNMTALFQSLNISIRGHNVLWDVPMYLQPWIKELNAAQLDAAVNDRVNDVVSRYAGKFKHWDVYNEALHGGFFEAKFNNSKNKFAYAAGVFRKVKSIDPNVKLFINDFNVVEYPYDPSSTPEKFINEAYAIEAGGGVVDGLGCQGHFSGNNANGPRVRAVLDALNVSQIPVWITELDIREKDPNLQADKFETVMRETFAHPAVQGIVLWEVARPNCSRVQTWRCSQECSTCLTDSNFVDRPVGKRYLKLRKEWTSHRVKQLDASGNLYTRGFFGKYRATIFYKRKTYYYHFQVPEGTSKLNFTFYLPKNVK